MKHTLKVMALCTTLATLSTHAEMRTWTDARGNTIEAELVENMHGNVTLLRADGEETFIKISNLSADDQKYILINTPPNIDVRVNKITDRKNKGYSYENPNDSNYDNMFQVQTSDSRYRVTLKRSGTIPYKNPITAELYVIGFRKARQEFVILNKTIETFTYGEGDVTDTFVFESKTMTTKNLQGNRDKGVVYHGNVVALVDDKGHVFDVKGSRSGMEQHIAFIRDQNADFAMTKEEIIEAISEEAKNQ